MLNITGRKSAKKSRDYYSPAKADREAAPGHVRTYGGKGLEHLGVQDELTARGWGRIVGNQTPDGRGQITPNQLQDRTSIVDFTFNVPKSVSLAIEFSPQGKQILQAVLTTADRVMTEHVEPLAAAKYNEDGRQGTRHTGNLTWAREVHALARPEKGSPMPNWHLHYQVANHTFDPKARDRRGNVTGGFRALNLYPIKKHAAELEREFHRQLRHELQGMGIGVRTTTFKSRDPERQPPSWAWEIAAVPDATVRKFSERRGRIERELAEVEQDGGHITGRLIRAIGHITREPKPTTVDRDALHAEWESRLTDGERRAFKHVAARPKINRPPLTRHQRQLAFVRKAVNLVVDLGRLHERAMGERDFARE